MSAFQIKLIAIATMVIDHIGLFFFPQFTILRVIGRVSFPLFAWLIANGAIHTRDIRIYGLKLLALAVVSQVPFMLANGYVGSPVFLLNVVFTLFAGLLAICAIRALPHRVSQGIAVTACAILASLIHADYGAAGVLSIVAFYVFFEKKTLMAISQALILGIFPVIMGLVEAIFRIQIGHLYISSYFEGFGLLALGFILLYGGQIGVRANALFYYFYPIQYVLIYIGLILFR